MEACYACQRKRVSDYNGDCERRKTTRSCAKQACEAQGCTNNYNQTTTRPSEFSSREPAIDDARPKEHLEHKAVHLLMKACEREDVAEERAETAEAQLSTVREQLTSAESRARAAESSLSESMARVKQLELQLVERCTGHAVASQDASDTDSNDDVLDGMLNDDTLTPYGSDSSDCTSLKGNVADAASPIARLTLQVQSLIARLTLAQQAETNAKTLAEASLQRLEVVADMVRGCAAVAFAGNDASSCRLRHHLFRCLDVDADGFLGEADMRHWYDEAMKFLEVQEDDPVKFEALRQQLFDALHVPNLSASFVREGKVSLMQLVRSKLGACVICTLLNVHNMMQERANAEWAAVQRIPLDLFKAFA